MRGEHLTCARGSRARPRGRPHDRPRGRPRGRPRARPRGCREASQSAKAGHGAQARRGAEASDREAGQQSHSGCGNTGGRAHGRAPNGLLACGLQVRPELLQQQLPARAALLLSAGAGAAGTRAIAGSGAAPGEALGAPALAAALAAAVTLAAVVARARLGLGRRCEERCEAHGGTARAVPVGDGATALQQAEQLLASDLALDLVGAA
mmetsp:Transcript_44248/g.137123  ORF Transcript_44248/g.137123 Transcript_44248/m.137123 type:complete len:208 (-) Transcript_44248:709-1332(-)